MCAQVHMDARLLRLKQALQQLWEHLEANGRRESITRR
jgi:hypothetical protein